MRGAMDSLMRDLFYCCFSKKTFRKALLERSKLLKNSSLNDGKVSIFVQ